MMKYTLVMVAMFLVVATLLAALIVAATNVTDAYADTCIDQTTGQPCPPRGNRMGGSCMENPGGHLLSGVADYSVMLLAPLVAIGALVVTKRKQDDDDRE